MRRREEGSTCSSTRALHGLYFASWYLYLNSDGVTYEGGTYGTKRAGEKEKNREERDRGRKEETGESEGEKERNEE